MDYYTVLAENSKCQSIFDFNNSILTFLLFKIVPITNEQTPTKMPLLISCSTMRLRRGKFLLIVVCITLSARSLR